MNTRDYQTHWFPVCLKFFGPIPNTQEECDDWMCELDKLLGIKEAKIYLETPSAHDQPMTEDLKKLLVSLLGPHGQTLLRVYKIQKGSR